MQVQGDNELYDDINITPMLDLAIESQVLNNRYEVIQLMVWAFVSYLYRFVRCLLVVRPHFNSKGGDDPLFGRFQPPVRSSEVQRHQQAAIVRNFVQNILAVNANANVIVAGDLNDF